MHTTRLFVSAWRKLLRPITVGGSSLRPRPHQSTCCCRASSNLDPKGSRVVLRLIHGTYRCESARKATVFVAVTFFLVPGVGPGRLLRRALFLRQHTAFICRGMTHTHTTRAAGRRVVFSKCATRSAAGHFCCRGLSCAAAGEKPMGVLFSCRKRFFVLGCYRRGRKWFRLFQSFRREKNLEIMSYIYIYIHYFNKNMWGTCFGSLNPAK